ncbi:glucose 1-dehydrogenase [Chroogloeocystis siderophila]|uniref:Short chain dehydrogenase n=1 Tax=Chroogloeocystis siderophila 5.2 s.c.1 TaxID=247279 RepID=A0A1U7HL60_9CHRO|nr:glucose 1-dehydrogenase [Chroogloeocystis siderophila]OKH24265.1 short chain dehydrogenase [Chroogloeocystis siderophila 5.2 s.c.1]
MSSMNGKVAIVTGGSSGIGKATAIAFAKAGAKVVVAARRTLEGEDTILQIQQAGGEGLFVKTDVTQAQKVEALVNTTIETYTRLDFAFNNAGSGKAIPLIEMSEEDWEAEIAVNLKSIWLCMKYQIPAMMKLGTGAIVNVSSQGALVGVANYSAYGAAKGGVISLSRAAAAEYAEQKIRINTISPGAVKTDLWAEAPPSMLEQVASGIPLQRIGEPNDIAQAAVWLCSDAASFITGHNLVIDGGYTAVQ